MTRILVTTPDVRSFSQNYPILFLGKWCCLYNRRRDWEGLDMEIVPYHWDNRDQYAQDTAYMQGVYEATLKDVSNSLNVFHGTAHPLRYWRLLVGPWLYMFIHILFDRWSMVRLATQNHKIDHTIILNFSEEAMISFDLKGLNPDSIEWNHYIFGKAIQHQGKIRCLSKEVDPVPIITTEASGARSRKISWASLILRLQNFVLTHLTKTDEPFICQSYLPRWEEVKLQLSLGMVPKPWRVPDMENTPPDLAMRQTFHVNFEGSDEFHRFVYSMLPIQIPTVYLEGYAKLLKTVSRLPWPSRPKVIFTSNLFVFCEIFQAWAAAKAEKGFPLVFGQHGGLMGVAKWLPGEDHQVKTADRYLTWGWRDSRVNLYPVAVFTNVGKRNGTWSPQGNLLLVTVPMRVFSHRSGSWPVGPNQSERFVLEQISFARSLPESIRNTLVLRLHERQDKKMLCFYADHWRDAFPGVEIDGSTEPIEKRIRQCRLFVYTYNSTGFLETLGRNIPTVIFWPPELFELRASAQASFDRLKAVGIFHESAQSAAAHVSHVWENVAGWWNQPMVQEARREFCEQFARMPDKPIRALKKELLRKT